MNFEKYTRITKILSVEELADLAEVEKQTLKSISSPEIIDEYVTEILNLFYQAFDVDFLTFIKEIFFENQLMIRRTADNQDFIFSWFEQAKASPDLDKKKIQMVHVYRAMVSDVFEPYLSILVACIHLTEGTFDTFLQANLGAGEFNKHEFIKKRLKCTEILKGYFPIIRNAISHAGSHAIRYEKDHILFRKIKRGNMPAVDEVLTVTLDELIVHVQELIDFTQCIDVAMNIFGIDANDLIIKTPELAQEFYEKMFTPESHAVYRKHWDEEYQKIWEDQGLTTGEKYKRFAEMFTMVCKKYKMPVSTLKFIEAKKIVLILVPWKEIDLTVDQQVIRRISELIRYCILAHQYFHFHFEAILTEEEEYTERDTLQVLITKEELVLYHERNSSYLDLIHDGTIYKNKQFWPITVDFEALRELDGRSLGERPKRKSR